MKKEIRIGDRYKKLVVTGFLPDKVYPSGKNHKRVMVVCDCGVNKEMFLDVLRKSNTVSCGCYSREILKKSKSNLKHGLSGHLLYKCWRKMIERCYSPTATKFELWGGRGIRVCDEWRNDFMSFYNWAIANGWKEGLELDRYPNNDGNYEPPNCRWATLIEQANNKRNNIIVEFKGEKMTLPEACRLFGFNWRQYQEIRRRMKDRNCSFEDAVYRPLRKCKFFRKPENQ